MLNDSHVIASGQNVTVTVGCLRSLGYDVAPLDGGLWQLTFRGGLPVPTAEPFASEEAAFAWAEENSAAICVLPRASTETPESIARAADTAAQLSNLLA